MKPSLTDQLTWITDSLPFLLPEFILCLGIVLLVISSLFKRGSSRFFYFITLTTFLVHGFFLLDRWPSTPVVLFSNMLRADDFSASFKILIWIGGLLSLFMSDWKRCSMEFCLFLVAVLTGACFLLMSTNLIMVVLSLELISISSYVLTAGQGLDKTRSEAAWKFFLFGSASTAIMIFGMSYLFGLSGTLNFSSSLFFDNLVGQESPLLLIGGLMTLAGFLFKMTSVPFHLWAPDVYESTPTPVVAFFSVVPKLAGLGMLIKFSLALHLFGQSGTDWSIVLGVIALSSILAGNLAALAQQNAKRMMAWSSVAQSGFLLAGVSSFSMEGIRVTIFYAAIFTIMNFLTFLMIQLVEDNLKSAEMRSFAGWGYVATIPSIYLLIGLVSLVGLPPTAGFMAKLFVFSSLWEKYHETGRVFYAALVAVGLLATVISLFFYLRIPYFLFLKRQDSAPYVVKISPLNNLLALILVTLILALFFFPGLLMGWANKVNFVL